MENLQALRQRIRSVQNTQKITRAMQMVAGAKLRRAQEELLSARPYADALQGIADRYLKAQPDLVHPLLEGEERSGPVGLILVTSDTGLCGSYNERVAALAESFLKEYPSAELVTIGKKGNKVAGRANVNPTKSILDWGGRYDFDQVMELALWLEEQFLSGQVSSWWIAYTQFVSAMNFQPRSELLLPIEQTEKQAEHVLVQEKVITEPEPEAVTDALLKRYVRTRFQRLILEAFTSEHSARMMAMRNATDNADEMISHLTLVRNKARQASITKELIEVISGARALE